MYNTTDLFAKEIRGDNREFVAVVLRDGKIMNADVKSIKQYYQIASNNFITVGGAISSYVVFEIWNTDEKLENAVLTLEVGLDINGTQEFVPIGNFTAKSIKKSMDGLIEVTAYDDIQTKMAGAYFSDLKYPADAIYVLNEISQKTGVPIDTSNLEQGVMIEQRKMISESTIDDEGQTQEKVTYENPFNGYTYRESLGYIAMLFCKYAAMDRDGKIKFFWYEDTGYKITEDDYDDSLETSEVAFSVGKVTCNTTTETLEIGTGTNNVQLENPVMTKERLNVIYNTLKQLQFIPLTASFFGDIRLDIGDSVSVILKDGTIYRVPIMEISQDFDGGLKTKIRSYGGAEQENAVQSPILSKLERQYTELLLVKEIVANKAKFETVEALNGYFKELSAKSITTENLTAEVAKLGYAKIDLANIDTANIDKASVANLFVEMGLITSAVIKDGHVTGELDSVSINADSIKTGILSVDRLIINGSDKSLIFALNNAGELTSTSVDTLDGGLLTKRTITADKLVAESITTTELNVANIFGDSAVLNKIFAQDIEATGTIKGLTLTGTTGQFDSINIRNAINITFKDKELNDKTIELIDVYAHYDMDDPDTEFDESNNITPYIWFGADEARIGIKGVRVDMLEATLLANRVYSTYPIMEEGLFLQDKYVLPYAPGEKKYVYFTGAGFVTNGGKSVLFTIPLNKPCKGVSNVTIESIASGGVIIRQSGKYAYGSKSGWVEPASYKATLQNNAITVRLEFDNNTNAVNNDACGVEANIYVNFN